MTDGMPNEDIMRSLAQYLLGELLQAHEVQDIEPEQNLLRGGLLDSTGAVRLAGYIEERYCIEIEPVEFVPENFQTLSSLARFIARKRAASTG